MFCQCPIFGSLLKCECPLQCSEGLWIASSCFGITLAMKSFSSSSRVIMCPLSEVRNIVIKSSKHINDRTKPYLWMGN